MSIRSALARLAVVALLMSGGTAAVACSCMAPGTAGESRGTARAALEGASAIVEVEVLAGYEHQARTAEKVRVLRTLWGESPDILTLARGGFPSSASCDLLFETGERRLLILYPSGEAEGPSRLQPHGLCTDFLVQSPEHLAVLLKEAAAMQPQPAGVSLSSRPSEPCAPSSSR